MEQAQDTTVSYGDGGVELNEDFNEREVARIRGDLNADYEVMRQGLKPPGGLNDDMLGPVKSAEGLLNDVRKLAQGKQEADGSFQRGGMSEDMHDKQVRRIRDEAQTIIDQGATILPKVTNVMRTRFADQAFPATVDRTPEAESIKADLRDAFARELDAEVFLDRFDRADLEAGDAVALGRRLREVTRHGRHWEGIREQASHAVDDVIRCTQPTKRALMAYAQADDVEQTATMALNIADGSGPTMTGDSHQGQSARRRGWPMGGLNIAAMEADRL